MRKYAECSQWEKDEILQLCRYWRNIMDEYEQDFKKGIILTEQELWEEKYWLRQVIKKKIIEILNGY